VPEFIERSALNFSPIEKQMYKITTKSPPMLVLPEPAAAGCHVAKDENYNVLPQYCKTPC
jgi:hypothetical protein